MGRACSMHSRDEKCVETFGRDYSEDLCVDWRIISEQILENMAGCYGLDLYSTG
jgi:hypothetical protein